MNIRRYVANDMREALTSIRADLGADAVMLSSRKLPNGVEVIAAVDYDDSLFGGGRRGAKADASEQRAQARRVRADRAARSPAREPVAAPGGAGPRGRSTAESSVALEIKDLRRLLETQLASLAWSDLNRQAPVRARLLRELAKLGVDSTLAAELADEVPPAATYQEAMRARRAPIRRAPAARDLGHGRRRRRVRDRRADGRRQDDEHRQDCGSVRPAPQRRGARARQHRHVPHRRPPAAQQFRAHPARADARGRERRRPAPHARRFRQQEARAHRYGGDEPARRSPRQSVRDAEGRGPLGSHDSRAVGRCRPRLSRRSGQGLQGCQSGSADHHEARRGCGSRRRLVVGDQHAVCRSRISRTASACRRTCTAQRRSASGCCTTR